MAINHDKNHVEIASQHWYPETCNAEGRQDAHSFYELAITEIGRIRRNKIDGRSLYTVQRNPIWSVLHESLVRWHMLMSSMQDLIRHFGASWPSLLVVNTKPEQSP